MNWSLKMKPIQMSEQRKDEFAGARPCRVTLKLTERRLCSKPETEAAWFRTLSHQQEASARKYRLQCLLAVFFSTLWLSSCQGGRTVG